MIIERTDKEVIIRLPADINVDGLQRLIDYLSYKEVTVKSEAKQEEVDDLVRDVKSSWWQKNKERLTK